MSGIIGLYYPDGRPINRPIFEEMVDVLAHRGPDGRGVWFGEGIALGHQMLHTTDESLREIIPLSNQQSTYYLTGDIRIDNRKELINMFGAWAAHLTDAELVMKAYEKWGEQCPKQLIGAYAFAIWDLNRRTLFCARDHYGLKPFYYCHLPGNLFTFASEPKSILCLDAVPKRLNERAVADHLLVPVDGDATDTFYQDIDRLAPGHSLTISSLSFVIRQYWQLDPKRELHLSSDEEYAEALREHFEQAVSCRMRSAFPVGAMLSGGLDSSSIVSVAAQMMDDQSGPLRTYSAVFDKVQASDEREYIDAVVRKYNQKISPHFLSADSLSPLDEYDAMLWHQDSAIQAGNLYFFWNLYKQAKQHGVRVIQDGFDGDTTLSHGIGYFYQLAHQGKWLHLMKELRAHAHRWDLPWTGSMWLWVKKYKVTPALNRSPSLQRIHRSSKRMARMVRRPQQTQLVRYSWDKMIQPDFYTRIQGDLSGDRATPVTERQEHHHMLTRPLMHRIIEVWEASAAASGLDIRFPFCDRRLMEFCLAMPVSQKRDNGWSRIAMRRAMEGILPHKIQWRANKGNLGPSFDHGLLIKTSNALQELTKKDIGGISRYVNLDVLEKTAPQFREDRRDNNTLLHWRALSLALWLQQTGM